MLDDRIRRVEGGREVVRRVVKEGYLAHCTCRHSKYMCLSVSYVSNKIDTEQLQIVLNWKLEMIYLKDCLSSLKIHQVIYNLQVHLYELISQYKNFWLVH